MYHVNSTKNNTCSVLIVKMSSKCQLSLTIIPKVLYENRYCNQEGFSILACGGTDKNKKLLKQVLEIKIPSFKTTEFPSMKLPHDILKTVVINSDILAIVDSEWTLKQLKSKFTSVETYSPKSKNWHHKYIKVGAKTNFCICSFMRKLYVIGGYVRNNSEYFKSCHTYDPIRSKWEKKANLKYTRRNASCTVFEGKIIVTGGFTRRQYLKSVEAYDYYENKWNYLPNMIEERNSHASVSMGNKMFVIGGWNNINCEVFDSFSRTFTKIKADIKVPDITGWNFNALCIGNTVIVFHGFYAEHEETIIYTYDVVNEKWSNVKCDFTRYLLGSSFCQVLYLKLNM